MIPSVQAVPQTADQSESKSNPEPAAPRRAPPTESPAFIVEISQEAAQEVARLENDSAQIMKQSGAADLALQVGKAGPLQIPGGSSLHEAVANARRVRAAALTSVPLSSGDLKVASMAAQVEAGALREIAEQNTGANGSVRPPES